MSRDEETADMSSSEIELVEAFDVQLDLCQKFLEESQAKVQAELQAPTKVTTTAVVRKLDRLEDRIIGVETALNEVIAKTKKKTNTIWRETK